MGAVVYLLHFERPLCPGRHTAQHYLGWALDLDVRLAAHRAGRGARLTQIAVERGIGFEVVRTWPGDRTLERKLKNRKESPRFCPLCFPTCRYAACAGAVQLVLPLEDPAVAIEPWPAEFEFPPPTLLRPSWAEIAYERRARAVGLALHTSDDWDEGLL